MAKIIVAEPDQLFRESLVSYISQKVPGAEVDEVANPDGLVAKVESGDYSLVFTNLGADANLNAGVGGSIFAIKRIRREKPALPIYVVSAHLPNFPVVGHRDFEHAVQELGATGYVYKGDLARGTVPNPLDVILRQYFLNK